MSYARRRRLVPYRPLFLILRELSKHEEVLQQRARDRKEHIQGNASREWYPTQQVPATLPLPLPSGSLSSSTPALSFDAFDYACQQWCSNFAQDGEASALQPNAVTADGTASGEGRSVSSKLRTLHAGLTHHGCPNQAMARLFQSNRQ